MIIQPIGSAYADVYYQFRNIYPYRRESLYKNPLVENKLAVTDVVELSPEAQALLSASTKNENTLVK